MLDFHKVHQMIKISASLHWIELNCNMDQQQIAILPIYLKAYNFYPFIQCSFTYFSHSIL